jgi:hypothetical protein
VSDDLRPLATGKPAQARRTWYAHSVDDLIAERANTSADRHGHLPFLTLKSGDGSALHDALDVDRRITDNAFEGIRCPVCAWRPDASSLWCCACVGTPEPPFAACGTFWNTFDTRGQCPGARISGSGLPV